MSDPRTLYDRIGGASAIADLVDRFYAVVMKDESLRPYFANVAMDKVKRMQEEFISLALGGPRGYSGRSIKEAHGNLRITLVAFQKFMQHLFEVLQQYDLSQRDCYDVICRLNCYVNDVVCSGPGLVD
jgi:hemoglobin